MYQNDTLNAREVVAKETGVSPATIVRDTAYAEAAS
jgi:DNA-binding MurR/RpiR family transcriptional regulator